MISFEINEITHLFSVDKPIDKQTVKSHKMTIYTPLHKNDCNRTY